MATYITLEEAKEHLRVDFADDDNYITNLIEVVESTVAIEIGVELSTIATAGVLPKGLTHAMLLMVAHFYMMREPVTVGVSAVKIPFGFDYLISPYKNWTIA